MSYVPPHKRHENAAVRASSSIIPSLKNTKKIYANNCIFKWFLVGSEENNNLQLLPLSSEWRKAEEEKKRLLVLAKSDSRRLETPWLCAAEKVKDDLILGFGKAKKTLVRYGSEDANPRLFIRFGKVVFNGARRDGPLTKTTLETRRKSFKTNVPKSYIENIEYGVVPKMGFSAEETKELYHVKVADKTRPDLTISCKCTVDQQHKRLNFYKAELNALRHLRLDVSCLDQDLDMRLTIDSKETLTNLSENEVNNLKELVDSALIDPNVKGGLKWPLGKSSSADRYSVCGVWHTVATTYRNPTIWLQVREADRYDFRTGIGGTSREVYLKLKALSTKLLKGEEMDRECVSNMLKDGLKVVWDYFLKAV